MNYDNSVSVSMMLSVTISGTPSKSIGFGAGLPVGL
jgi:hypothetical protein